MSTFYRKLIVPITVLLTCSNILFAQNANDSVQATIKSDTAITHVYNNRLSYKQLIIPAVFISYGVAALEIKNIKQLNISTHNEIVEDKPHHVNWDNYTQFVPAVMVYGLNAAGLKGKHNFRDRIIIYATSQLLSASFVVPLKHIVKEERPDGSDNLSFPSGHSATAFSSAQFMFREYKEPISG